MIFLLSNSFSILVYLLFDPRLLSTSNSYGLFEKISRFGFSNFDNSFRVDKRFVLLVDVGLFILADVILLKGCLCDDVHDVVCHLEYVVKKLIVSSPFHPFNVLLTLS